MGKLRVIFGLAVIGFAVIAVWQIGSCELANIALRGELRDLAAQVGGRIGLDAPSSDDDLRNDVIRKAGQHEIRLEPEQITVQRSGPNDAQTIYLAVDYTARVNLLVFSFPVHFKSSSKR